MVTSFRFLIVRIDKLYTFWGDFRLSRFNYFFLFFFLASGLRLYLYVSGNGKRVLLITLSGYIFLWEYLEFKNILTSKHPSLMGQWSQIIPKESAHLPSAEDKEAVVHAVFIKNEVKSKSDRVS